MRILIVDDEAPARQQLRRLLALAPGVAAVEEAADGFEALERIARFQPDALLLDIDMPELSGIELAASLPEPAPLVVFVTAHERYAIQAFDCHAIDYLLKPCDSAHLGRSLQRLQERLGERLAARDRQPQREPAQVAAGPLRQLLVSDRGVTRVVPVADIGWIETADNYVHCIPQPAARCCARRWPDCWTGSGPASCAATGAPPCDWRRSSAWWRAAMATPRSC